MCVCCGVHFDAKVSSVFLYVSQRMPPEDVRNSLVQSLDRCKFILFRSEIKSWCRVCYMHTARDLVCVCVCLCAYVCVCASGNVCVCACVHLVSVRTSSALHFQIINLERVAVCVRFGLETNSWL